MANPLAISMYLIICETHDAVTEAFQRQRAGAVPNLGKFVGIAVDFDDEISFKANEIHDVAIDRALPAKLEPAQSSITQNHPQKAFGRG